MKLRVKYYVFGFGISLFFTLAAYFLVQHHIKTHHLSPSDNAMLVLLSFFAISQFVAQMVFFLHLGAEPKPKWNLITFMFMATTVLIIVGGSIWIMTNLNYHMGSPDQTDKYIIKDEGFGHQH